MWRLRNRTRYAVGQSWTRDMNGDHIWLVSVKASFDIGEHGQLRLADEQMPVLQGPEFWGDPAHSSLRFDADVVPPKPTTDVLIEASAYAPSGRPVPMVQVSVRVAEIEKSIVVHGPRVYSRNGRTVESAEPFVSHPIRYEDAYGGSDLADPNPRRQRYYERNPVGKGIAYDPSTLQYQPAHRIEYPHGNIEQTGPAGLGPLASFWTPRRERAGTYDEAWEKQRKPLWAADYDERCLLSAPDDQQPRQHLHGGESIVLTNLAPGGSLSLQLPKIYLAFSTLFGSRTEEHRSKLGTVLVTPDTKKLTMAWNTALKVRAPDVDYLDETVITEKKYLA